MATADLEPLQTALGHHFSSQHLLQQALTHSSLAYEHSADGRTEAGAQTPTETDNERLEFLGDALLGLVVAELLYRRFPEMHEGEWTRLRANLVSRRHMAHVATSLDLGRYLLLGRGEERSGGRRKSALLANAMEAVIAALYLDAGLEAVQRFITQHVVAPYITPLRQELNAGSLIGDHKSALQELLQARKAGAPEYLLKGESGPDHRKRFLVEVRLCHEDGEARPLARGIGTTKKKAEQEAARRAFRKLRPASLSETVAEGNPS